MKKLEEIARTRKILNMVNPRVNSIIDSYGWHQYLESAPHPRRLGWIRDIIRLADTNDAIVIEIHSPIIYEELRRENIGYTNFRLGKREKILMQEEDFSLKLVKK